MRILLVSNSLQGGGAERVMATMAGYLAQRHSVRLLAIWGNEAEYDVSDAVEVFFANDQRYNRNLVVDWIADHIDDFVPDITMSFLHGVNEMAIMARYRACHDTPVVISERVDPTWATQPELLIGREHLYPLADGGIFQTPEIEEHYRTHHGMRNTTTLVNPLSPSFELEPYVGDRDKRIVAVGRLAPEKNHALLIRAFGLIAGEFPEHVLEIYGEGELLDELQAQIAGAGLENRVFLRGRVADVPAHIAGAELFVHSSLHEGMPNAVLEAMALGLPCVVTDTPYGGTAALVDPGIDALIVPTNDEYALAEGMRAMLGDSRLRASISAAAPTIIDRYRTDIVCPSWEAYLERTVRDYERPANLDALRQQAEKGFRMMCDRSLRAALKERLTREQLVALRSWKHSLEDAKRMGIMAGTAIARGCALRVAELAQPAQRDGAERLKIAFVVYNIAGGGAERVITVLARHLSERHDVSIVTCVDDRRDYDPGPNVDIVCEFVPTDPENIKRIASIYRGLAKVQPDIAVSFLSKTNWRALASGLLLGKNLKVVISERNCPHHDFNTARRRRLFKFIYLFADGGIFQTRDALAYWTPWCRNAVILPNPLNQDIRERGLRRGEQAERSREARIVNTGRLVPQKNHAQLIRAFSCIADEFPEYVLEIYGEGVLRDELESLIDELGLGERVLLMGRVPSDEIAARIEDAALFVFPSLWEGLPNALIEAMALGLPCIASDCSIGGPRDLIDDGENGLLIPVADEGALIEAMRRLLSDSELAEHLGRQATLSAERYEADRVCREWEKYLLATSRKGKAWGTSPRNGRLPDERPRRPR